MQLSQPFLHAAQSQALLVSALVFWVESLPIVNDGQTDPLCRPMKLNRHGRRLCVFHHILDAFLHDAEETGRLIERHRIRKVKNLQMNG